jgi:hypothetical protein
MSAPPPADRDRPARPGRDRPSGARPDRDSPTRLTIARRALAGVLVAAWIAVTWISFQTSYLQTCEDEVARVGNAPLIKSCGPLGLTDAPLLVLIGAAVLLLLPDVTSIEIPGIVRLERRVEAQSERQEEIAQEIKNVMLAQNQRQEQGQSQASQQRQNVTVVLQEANKAALGAVETERLVDEFSDKKKLYVAEFGDTGRLVSQVDHKQQALKDTDAS